MHLGGWDRWSDAMAILKWRFWNGVPKMMLIYIKSLTEISPHSNHPRIRKSISVTIRISYSGGFFKYQEPKIQFDHILEALGVNNLFDMFPLNYKNKKVPNTFLKQFALKLKLQKRFTSLKHFALRKTVIEQKTRNRFRKINFGYDKQWLLW